MRHNGKVAQWFLVNSWIKLRTSQLVTETHLSTYIVVIWRGILSQGISC